MAGKASMGTSKAARARAIFVNLELWQARKNRLAILVQRAPPRHGCEQSFAEDVVEWAKGQGIARIMVVGGAAATKGVSLCCFQTSAAPSDIGGVLANAQQGWEQWTEEQWVGRFPFSGMLRPLLLALESRKVSASAVVLFCCEGNNFAQGLQMAEVLVQQLHLEGHELLQPISSGATKSECDQRATPPLPPNTESSPQQGFKLWKLRRPPSWKLVERDCAIDSHVY